MNDTVRDDDPYATRLIGALLRVPWEAVQQRLFTELREHGYHDLNPAHLGLLVYPGPAAMRPSELARRNRMSKQALHYLLDEMERLGYLARVPHPHDRRSKLIAMTARGEEVVRFMREVIMEVEREWERAMGRERVALLRELLTDLTELTAHGATPVRRGPDAVSA